MFWVVAAAAILVLGLALRSDPPRDTLPAADMPADEAPPTPARPVPDPPATAPSPPAPLPPPAGPAGRLVERALRDARRASPAGGGWTAQVAVLCDPAGAEAIVSAYESDSRLYVFPAEIGGRSCFRICWGSFPDAEGARAAPVPAGLLGGAKATPKRMTEILP